MSESDAGTTENNSNDIKPKLIKLKRLKPVSKSIQSTSKLKCVLCSEQFEDQIALKEHFRKHGEDTAVRKDAQTRDASRSDGFPCEFCCLVFTSIGAVVAHKYKKHRSEGSNYSCEICGGLFTVRVALEKHKEKCCKPEENTKKNIQEEFKKTNCLNKIESTENSTYTCKFCKAAFITAEALRFHEQRGHIVELDMLNNVFLPPPSTKIRVNHKSEVYSVYYCYLCGSQYVLKFNLKKHLLQHHTAEERTNPPAEGMIRCNLCEGLFYTKKAYEGHRHRDDDLYVISEEHRKQVVNRIDQDFDINRVPPKIETFEATRRKVASKGKAGTSIQIINMAEESMSPPSSASESSDELDNRKPVIRTRRQKKHRS